MLDLSKMTKQELQAMLETKLKQDASGLQVKLNSSGGIYIRHSSFKEFSQRTQKEYVAGINIPFITAKVLFNDPALLKDIQTAINNLK